MKERCRKLNSRLNAYQEFEKRMNEELTKQAKDIFELVEKMERKNKYVGGKIYLHDFSIIKMLIRELKQKYL